METSRILHAASGRLIIVSILFGTFIAGGVSEFAPAQEFQSTEIAADTAFAMPDTTYPLMASIDTLVPELKGDTTHPMLYEKRVYFSRGSADEIKGIPGFFMETAGTIGSPAIPINYLNVLGPEITINGLPFPYSGLYRPFLFGADLNVIPWEILRDIHSYPVPAGGSRLDFSLGRPNDQINRSDVETAQGPYDFRSSGWRFFRPFGQKTYAYFTAGFKKAIGFIENADYNGYHITAGISRHFGNGILGLDVWRHHAEAGLNSFDFFIPQQSRQSRNIDRGELRYLAKLKNSYYLNVTAVAQKNAQTISGYTSNPVKVNDNLGGAEVAIIDSLGAGAIRAQGRYFRLGMIGNTIRERSTDLASASINATGRSSRYEYIADFTFSWNEIDGGAATPALNFTYALSSHLKPHASISRLRHIPDLHLLYLGDFAPALGIPGFLQNYSFLPNQKLSFPFITEPSLGIGLYYDKWQASIDAAYKYIKSQVTLSVAETTAGNFVFSPVNYTDKYFELAARTSYASGPVSGEAWGALRNWKDKYFQDGLEKGPRALGFVRLSFLRQFFIPRLYLGGSLEFRASSRAEYRSLKPGLTGSFVALDSRFEFRYKDFTFWLYDENLSNTGYITYWPYYNTPRSVWWGIRWNLFD